MNLRFLVLLSGVLLACGRTTVDSGEWGTENGQGDSRSGGAASGGKITGPTGGGDDWWGSGATGAGPVGGGSNGGTSTGGVSTGGAPSGVGGGGGRDEPTGGSNSGGSSGGSPGGAGGLGGAGGGGAAGGVGGGNTGGSAFVCVADDECASLDACLVGRCDAGSCVTVLRDRDADGVVDALCGGDDCNDRNPGARPGLQEVCGDGSDNDCNGVADCFDPFCRTDGACGCVSLGSEDCENGSDDDCDGAVDCLDAECVGTVACGCAAESCGNGFDDDCDGAIDCEDFDCSSRAECTCSAVLESCQNGTDDDCDGRIDCADDSCAFAAACLCLVPRDEVCDDDRDNDCDGLVDCGDPQCFAHVACQTCVSEVCQGGEDEDCDGLVDCADPSCAFDALCPPRAEVCNNGRDDDLDGLGDCNDPDCRATEVCLEKQNTCPTARRIEALSSASYEGDTTGQLSNFRGSCGGDAGEAVFVLQLHEPARVHLDTIGTSFDSNLYVRRGACEAGSELACDDDSGGVAWSSALTFRLLQPGTYYVFVDGLTVDPIQGADQGRYVLNVEVEPALEECGDQFDNDGDGYWDCADSDCAQAPGCESCNEGAAPVAELGVERCTDGLDNDCDGLSDCEDEDCSASDENGTECCNGIDQNGNGIVDDFSCRCVSDADCDDGQTCYTSTLGACGLPCDRFVGQLCPFFAPGSVCNPSTRQCEF